MDKTNTLYILPPDTRDGLMARTRLFTAEGHEIHGVHSIEIKNSPALDRLNEVHLLLWATVKPIKDESELPFQPNLLANGA